LHLSTETYSACGKMVCMTPSTAQKALSNKVATIRWINQANALFDYYERRDNPAWLSAVLPH
jgi:hypothetical protein